MSSHLAAAAARVAARPKERARAQVEAGERAQQRHRVRQRALEPLESLVVGAAAQQAVEQPRVAARAQRARRRECA
eukprot:7213722-Prymnesium_polylepis.1